MNYEEVLVFQKRNFAMAILLICTCIGGNLVVSKPLSAQLAFELPPIRYSNSQPTDPVFQLKVSLDSREKSRDRLQTSADHGYLLDLLRRLKVPISSQTLVFSKTSVQRHLIKPSNPRAIYFNDEVYVAWVPGGDFIEIASTDAQLGSVFYIVPQPDSDDAGQIQRKTDRCLFCHASSDTERNPGLMMRSVFTDPAGQRANPSGSLVADPRGPITGRWAGWYVSGTHGSQQHLGNQTTRSNNTISVGQKRENQNTIDLANWFDTAKYPSPHSDLVALLVLQHQVDMHNQLTQSNHQTRSLIYAQQQNASADTSSNSKGKNSKTQKELKFENELNRIAERLTDALLMVDTIRFTEPVEGISQFSSDFAQKGPRDRDGRSLRRLDLKEALFEYPCSYLIYSDSFDQLPKSLVDRVYKRIGKVMMGKDTRDKYSHLSAEKRESIHQILTDTKPEYAKRFAP